MNTLTYVLVSLVLLLSAVQEEPGYNVSFTGEDLGPIEAISLAANDHIYLAYTLPDQDATMLVALNPELEELSSTLIEGLHSPCVTTYRNTVYLAGIKNEDIVLQEFSTDLELIEAVTITVEEPVDVYILSYEEGILLAYVHRFLENSLLRQDVFVKKLDFSFQEVAEARLTDWDYWEDPCLAVYKDTIILSYGDAPLVSIFGRHVVITTLNKDLEELGETRYPVEVTEKKNVVQTAIAVVHDEVVAFFRITDRDFSVSKFTWEGTVTVVPGNIQAVTVKITDELALGETVVITEDTIEEYEPAAVSAFDKVYFAYWISEENGLKLQVISADTVEGLKVEPPEEKSFTWIIIVVVVVLAGLGVLLIKKRSRTKGKKKKARK